MTTASATATAPQPQPSSSSSASSSASSAATSSTSTSPTDHSRPQAASAQNGQSPVGPPHYVDLHVNAGECVSLQLLDGQEQIIAGPATVTMISQQQNPPVPIPVQVPPGHMIQQIADENGTLKHIILSIMDSSMGTDDSQLTSTLINLPQGQFRIGANGELISEPATSGAGESKGTTPGDAAKASVGGDDNANQQQAYYANYDGCPVVGTYNATTNVVDPPTIVGQVVLDSTYTPNSKQQQAKYHNNQQSDNNKSAVAARKGFGYANSASSSNNNNKLRSESKVSAAAPQAIKQHHSNDKANNKCNTIQSQQQRPTTTKSPPKEKQANDYDDQVADPGSTLYSSVAANATTAEAVSQGHLMVSHEVSSGDSNNSIPILTHVDGQMYGYPACGCCCCYCDPAQTNPMDCQQIHSSSQQAADLMLMPPPPSQPQDHLSVGPMGSSQPQASGRSAVTSSVAMMAPYSSAMVVSSTMPSMPMQPSVGHHQHSASPVQQPMVSQGIFVAQAPTGHDMMGLVGLSHQSVDVNVVQPHQMPPHGKGRGINGGYKQHRSHANQTIDRQQQVGGHSYQSYNNIVAGSHHGHYGHHDSMMNSTSGYNRPPAYAGYGNHVPATLAAVVSQGLSKQHGPHQHNSNNHHHNNNIHHHHHHPRGVDSESFNVQKQQQQRRDIHPNHHYYSNSTANLSTGYAGSAKPQQHNIENKRQSMNQIEKSSRHSSINSKPANSNSNHNNNNISNRTNNLAGMQQVAGHPSRAHDKLTKSSTAITHNQHNHSHNQSNNMSSNPLRAQGSTHSHHPTHILSHHQTDQNIQQQQHSSSVLAQGESGSSFHHSHGSRPPANKSTIYTDDRIIQQPTIADQHKQQHISNSDTTEKSSNEDERFKQQQADKIESSSKRDTNENLNLKQQVEVDSEPAATGDGLATLDSRSSRGKQKRQQQNDKTHLSDTKQRQKAITSSETGSLVRATEPKIATNGDERSSQTHSSQGKDHRSPISPTGAKHIKRQESSLDQSKDHAGSNRDSSSSRDLDSSSSPSSSNKSSSSIATSSSNKIIDCDQVSEFEKEPSSKQESRNNKLANTNSPQSRDSPASSSGSSRQRSSKSSTTTVAKSAKHDDHKRRDAGGYVSDEGDDILVVEQVEPLTSVKPAAAKMSDGFKAHVQSEITLTMRNSFSENNIQSLERNKMSDLKINELGVKPIADMSISHLKQPPRLQSVPKSNQANKRRGSSARNEHNQQHQPLKPNSVSQVKLLNLHCTSATPTSVHLRWSYNPSLSEEYGIQQVSLMKGHHMFDHFVVESSCIKNADENSLVAPKIVYKGCAMSCKINHLSSERIYHFKVKRTALVTLAGEPTSAVSEILSVTLPSASQLTSMNKKEPSVSSSLSSHSNHQQQKQQATCSGNTGSSNGSKLHASSHHHQQVKFSNLMRQYRTRLISTLGRLVQRSLSSCSDAKFAGLLLILFTFLAMLLAVFIHVYIVAPVTE